MPSNKNDFDVLVIGGGVIGLSLAWDLSRHGAQVCLVDRGRFGQEASWAGAGMVPPGPKENHWHLATPLEQLAGFSQALHQRWHDELKERTGIDNGYRQKGAVYLAFSEAQAKVLNNEITRWKQLGISCNAIDGTTLADIEPALTDAAPRALAAYVIPTEAQIRNPWHVRALVAACERDGVDMRPNLKVHQFQKSGNHLLAAKTADSLIRAKRFCLAAGCWSGQLAAQLGLHLKVKPVRGQIVLLKGTPGLLQRNVSIGPRYLVPREDGHILIGSTEEDVGYDNHTTAVAESQLLEFGSSIAPAVAQLPVEHRWAGLRPASADGLPFLGQAPQIENLWLATGHFRAGLQLSSGTAVVVSAMLRGTTSPVDVSQLSADR